MYLFFSGLAVARWLWLGNFSGLETLWRVAQVGPAEPVGSAKRLASRSQEEIREAIRWYLRCAPSLVERRRSDPTAESVLFRQFDTGGRHVDEL